MNLSGEDQVRIVGALLDLGIDVGIPAVRDAVGSLMRADTEALRELARRHAALRIAQPLEFGEAQDLGEGEG